MRLKLSIFLMLFMSWAAMALERLPRPEDASRAEQWGDLFKGLIVLAFLTPVGWCVLIMLIVGIIMWLKKAVVHVATTDFSRIPEEDKRDELLNELKDC
jgi:hypothetical protein